MQWLEITVKVYPEAVESVSELLNRYTDDGIAIEEPIELAEGGTGYRVLAGEPVAIRMYLPMDRTEEEKLQQIKQALWHLSRIGERFIGDLETGVVHNEDWANAWKEHFHVTHIGQYVVIRPSWRDYQPQPGEIVLTLDPGMAFGTGLHPTTRMCVELLEQLVKPGMRVIDVGCGSGLLSLLAAKLGAAHVDAIDNDGIAVESTIANAQLNGESDRITTMLGVLDDAAAERMARQYDVVVSNILAHVIGAMAPQLAKVMAPAGALVVSGIIEPRLHDALDPLLAAGLEQVSQVKIDDWMALLLRKHA